MTDDEKKMMLDYVLGQRGSRPLIMALQDEPEETKGFILRHLT